jgi:hypothetical protein
LAAAARCAFFNAALRAFVMTYFFFATGKSLTTSEKPPNIEAKSLFY